MHRVLTDDSIDMQPEREKAVCFHLEEDPPSPHPRHTHPMIARSVIQDSAEGGIDRGRIDYQSRAQDCSSTVMSHVIITRDISATSEQPGPWESRRAQIILLRSAARHIFLLRRDYIFLLRRARRAGGNKRAPPHFSSDLCFPSRGNIFFPIQVTKCLKKKKRRKKEAA